jgi:hypothetical protein
MIPTVLYIIRVLLATVVRPLREPLDRRYGL